MKFSKTKFDQLTDAARIRKLLQFIRQIELNWEDIGSREELIANFKDFLRFFPENMLKNQSDQLDPGMGRREFLQVAVPLEQKYNYDNRVELLIKKLDGQREENTALPLILVLDNLRSAFNVGSIIRSAECFGIETIYLCGYTPDNDRVAKTAMGTRNLVQISHFHDAYAAMRKLREMRYSIYALETAEKSQSIYQAEIKYPCALIVGNEALGISIELLASVDSILEIPLTGWKNSLNVAAAAAIAISELYRKIL